MLMVSRFGAALRFLESERKAMGAFQSMLKELSESQRLDLSDVWYLVAGKEDILREEVS